MINIGTMFHGTPVGEYTIVEHTDRHQRYSVTHGTGFRRTICYYSEAYLDCLEWIGNQPRRSNNWKRGSL